MVSSGGQVSDRDSGANADAPGAGRGPPRTAASGQTDRDSGAAADRGGYGRGQRSGAATVGPSPQRVCRQLFQGEALQLVQSNNITVTLWVGEHDNGYVDGAASFVSTVLRPAPGPMGTTVDGRVEGQHTGDRVELRIAWHAVGVNDDDDVVRYQETGLYFVTIDDRGAMTGYSYPFERPNARSNFFIRGYLRCI